MRTTRRDRHQLAGRCDEAGRLALLADLERAAAALCPFTFQDADDDLACHDDVSGASTIAILPSMPTMALVLATLLGTADASFGWPDSITAAAHDATELPDPQRLRTLERLTARAGERALPVLLPLLSDRDPEHPPVRRPPAGARRGARRPRRRDAAGYRRPACRSSIVSSASTCCAMRPVLPDAARQAVERALRDPDAAVRISALDGAGTARRRCRRCQRFCPRSTTTAARCACARSASSAARAIRASPCPCLSRVEDADRQVRTEAIRALGSHPRGDGGAAAAARATQPRRRARRRWTRSQPCARMPRLPDLRRAGAPPAGGRCRAPRAARARQDGDARRRRGADRARPGRRQSRRRPRRRLRAAGVAAVPALERELVTGTPGSAAVAAAVLGDIGDRRATRPAERRARAPTPSWRRWPSTPSRASPIPRRCPRWRARPNRTIWRRAAAAYAALLALRDPRAGVRSTRGLADADAHVRELSARLAAAIGATAAAPAVGALLGDRERDVSARGRGRAGRSWRRRPRRWWRRSSLRSRNPGAAPRDGGRMAGDRRRARAAAAEPGDAGRAGGRLEERAGPPNAPPSCARSPRPRPAGRSRIRPWSRSSSTRSPARAAAARGGRGAGRQPDTGGGARPPSRADSPAPTPTVRARLCDAIARMPDGGPLAGGADARARRDDRRCGRRPPGRRAVWTTATRATRWPSRARMRTRRSRPTRARRSRSPRPAGARNRRAGWRRACARRDGTPRRDAGSRSASRTRATSGRRPTTRAACACPGAGRPGLRCASPGRCFGTSSRRSDARRPAPRPWRRAITAAIGERQIAGRHAVAQLGRQRLAGARRGRRPRPVRRSADRRRRASNAPTTPHRTSPLPAVASAGQAIGLMNTAPVGRGDHRARALEHDDRARRGRQSARARPSRSAWTSAVEHAREPAHLRRVRRQRSRGAGAAASRSRRVGAERVQRVGVEHHRQRAVAQASRHDRPHPVAGRDPRTDRDRLRARRERRSARRPPRRRRPSAPSA